MNALGGLFSKVKQACQNVIGAVAHPSQWFPALIDAVKRGYHRVVEVLPDPSKPLFIQNIVAAFLTAFFATSVIYVGGLSIVQNLNYTDLAFVSAQHVLVFALSWLIMTAMIVMLSTLFSAQRVIPACLLLSVTAFGLLLMNDGGRNIWLGVGLAILLFISCRWIFKRFEAPFSEVKLSYTMVKLILTILFVWFVGYMSLMGVCRYYSFGYNSFDFGIFAQMFDYMKETGIPYTTVERGQLLSHFAVHFSPFFYVLLPGYLVFSTPAYLCVVQTLFVGAGVFAVYGIAKELGFSPKQTLLAGVIFLFYPAFSYGLYFDFHENKFLTFCILFTIYFLLKRKVVPFYLFAILLCTVKEDAPIYLVAIALFMLCRERLFKHGLITLVLALGYFVFALKMIEVCGALEANQFGYRYSNFALNGESTIGNIIKITILDFGYTLAQMFKQEKMEFLLWMFVPVLLTPFLNKKVSTLLLLTPMLLVNLMSNWQYQYDVDYQYTFGTGAMILVCALLALKEMPPQKRNALLTTAAALSLILTVPRIINRNHYYIAGYTTKQAMYHEAMAFIDDNLNKESVIGVEGDVMPMLYDYPHLVLDPHDDTSAAKIEFFIAKKGDNNIKELTDRGFVLVTENDYLVIYENPQYQP